MNIDLYLCEACAPRDLRAAEFSIEPKFRICFVCAEPAKCWYCDAMAVLKGLLRERKIRAEFIPVRLPPAGVRPLPIQPAQGADHEIVEQAISHRMVCKHGNGPTCPECQELRKAERRC